MLSLHHGSDNYNIQGGSLMNEQMRSKYGTGGVDKKNSEGYSDPTVYEAWTVNTFSDKNNEVSKMI